MITVTVPERKVTIERCYHTCPFFALEGHVMICEHPSLEGKDFDAHAIIEHPDCDLGFPKECPLLKKGRK